MNVIKIINFIKTIGGFIKHIITSILAALLIASAGLSVAIARLAENFGFWSNSRR